MSDGERLVEGARFVVREAYSAQYTDPIAFRAGDAVRVEQSDPDFPEWHWCRAPDGKEGWVHVAFLSRREGVATALEDYSARELNVRVGDAGSVTRALGGWLEVRVDDGREGWVPESVAGAAV